MSVRAGPGVAIPPPALLLIGVAVPVALQVIVGGSFLPQGWIQLAIGIPVLVVGTAGFAAAGRTMQKAGTSPNPGRDASQLVAHGLFRVSRNPMTVANFVLLLGVALAFNGAWLLLMPLLYGVFGAIQVKREEPYLEQRFGEPYLQYRQQVQRWI